MALSGNDLYIADIGDNAQVFPTYNIYKFPEPAVAVDTIMTVDTIQFRYPDGSHDAEAFLIDPDYQRHFYYHEKRFPGKSVQTELSICTIIHCYFIRNYSLICCNRCRYFTRWKRNTDQNLHIDLTLQKRSR